MHNLKNFFLLDPSVTFLNHGSFGATPHPVFEAYQQWQRRLEQQPVHFLIEELPNHLATARQALGNYINANRDDVVYVPNATFALNVVARSLDLGPGDEVLTTNHEYGACNNVWRFLSQKRGFKYKQIPVAFPITSHEAAEDHIWRGVTLRTKVIFLSHVTSPTAVRLPVETICQRASQQNILTIIDGAHAPGQIPLDMQAIGADFYLANAHKWLMSPKGAAFLYTRPDKQRLIEPLVVGWGWGDDRTFSYGSDYLDTLQWLGTNDLSAYLSVSAAIAFQERHNWTAVRQECHELLREGLERINALTGLEPCYIDDSFYHQMGVARLPEIDDLPAFKKRLYDDFRVEIPCIQWGKQQFLRLSVQGYNTGEDIEHLIEALQTWFTSFRV